MSDSRSPVYLQRAALRIAAIYTLIALAWLVLSGWLVDLLVFNRTLQLLLRTSIGLLFVVVTAALLYGLIRRDLQRRQRTEQRYRVLFESSPNALLVLDQHGRCVDGNRVALRLTGYSYDELLQHTLAELTLPDGRGAPVDWRQLERLTPTAEPLSCRVLRKDGQSAPVEISLGPQMQHGERAYLAVMRDVSERRRAAEALEQSEMRFRSLFEDAPLGVTIARGGRSLYVNRTYMQIFGYDRSAEIVGRPLTEQVAPQARAMIAERNRRREAGLEVPSSYEMLGLRKDGSEFPCQVQVARIDLPEGPASVAFITDITERKQAEAHIQQQSARASVLAEVSRALAEQNLDHHAMLSTMVERTGPVVGDGCVIRLLTGDGQTLETAAIYHREAAARAFLQQVLRDMRNPNDQRVHSAVIQQGRPQPIPPTQPEQLRRLVPPEDWPLAVAFGAHSGLIVPLRARGRVLGTLSVLRRDHRPPFDDDDQLFIQELADRAALAVDSAQLYYASQQEIIERRAVEQALRTSEANLRAIFDGAHQSIVLIGPDHKLIQFNKYAQAGALAVYGKQMAPGQSILDYVAPEDHEDFTQRFRMTLEGHSCSLEKPIYGLKGVDWWEFYFNPIVLPSGQVNGIIFAARNITERKQAEAALREAERRLRTVVTHAPIVLTAIDSHSTITLAEGRGLDSLGLRSDELLGRSAETLYPPLTLTTNLRRTLAGDDCTSIDRRGRLVFETRWTPLRDQDDAIIGAITVSTDVTEREQAVTQLRETEAREQAILHGTSNAIFLKDLAGRYLLVNPSSARILGCSIEEAVGRHDADFFPAALAAEFQASDRQVLASGQQIETQEEVPVDGAIRSFLTLKAPYRDARGTIQGVIGISRDITDLRQTIEALRKSEATNRALLNAIPDLMFRVSHDGHYLDFHAPKGLEEQLSEYTIGQSIDQIVSVTLADQIRACIDGALDSGEMQTLDYQMLVRGKLHDFESRFVVSGEREVLAIVRDVTERKRLERALRDARDVYLTLVEEIPMLVWRLNLQGRIDFVNKRWIEYTGAGVEQLPADPDRLLIHPSDQAHSREATTAAWQQRQPFAIEYRLRRHDGVYRWIEARGTPFYDDDGRFAGYIGICSDINERKRQEQIKDDFLALASHELKTPLAALIGYIHLLERWSAQQDFSERFTQALSAMVGEGMRLNRLINELLDVSRIQTGKLRMFMQPTNLTDLLPQCVANVQVMLPERRWLLEIAPGPPLVVSADAQRMEQVLTNLCSNAAKYSAESAPVVIRLRRSQQSALIEVQDCGLGIPAADLPYIFDRFYQVQRPPRESRPGLGLGLFITREIIRQHGGTISATSVEYAGSVFTILLPLDRTHDPRD